MNLTIKLTVILLRIFNRKLKTTRFVSRKPVLKENNSRKKRVCNRILDWKSLYKWFKKRISQLVCLCAAKIFKISRLFVQMKRHFVPFIKISHKTSRLKTIWWTSTLKIFKNFLGLSVRSDSNRKNWLVTPKIFIKKHNLKKKTLSVPLLLKSQFTTAPLFLQWDFYISMLHETFASVWA